MAHYINRTARRHHDVHRLAFGGCQKMAEDGRRWRHWDALIVDVIWWPYWRPNRRFRCAASSGVISIMYCYVDLGIKQVNLRFYITRSYAVPNARHGWLVDLGGGPGSVFGHGVLKWASKISQETYGGSKSNWLKSFFPDLQWRGPDMWLHYFMYVSIIINEVVYVLFTTFISQQKNIYYQVVVLARTILIKTPK